MHLIHNRNNCSILLYLHIFAANRKFCMLFNIRWWELIFYAFLLITLVQLFYYLYFFRRLAFFKPVLKEKSQQHPVSVVVCARDEADNLARNLPGVLVQWYPTTHQVIVVNHNSQDETLFLLEGLQKTYKHLHAIN